MIIPKEFDTIRPFEPEELPEVYDRLLADQQFQTVLSYLYPQVPFEMIAAKMRQCETNLDFQKAFCYTFLKQLLAKASTGCDMDSSAIDNTLHADIRLSAIIVTLSSIRLFWTCC